MILPKAHIVFAENGFYLTTPDVDKKPDSEYQLRTYGHGIIATMYSKDIAMKVLYAMVLQETINEQIRKQTNPVSDDQRTASASGRAAR